MDIKSKWGQGGIRPGLQGGPEDGKAWDPLPLSLGGQAELSPQLGGIQGLGPGWGQTGIFGCLSAEFLLS